jgi:PAS domain S-box-containing protein
MLKNLKSHMPSVIIFCFGMILTFVIWDNAKSLVSHRINHDFTMRTDAITKDISDQLLSYEQVLWGGAGFIHATGNADRSQWREYVTSLKIEKHWPGIQGIGLSIPISQAEKSNHIAAMHAEGFPDYTIQPEGPRDEYSAIIFLEPFDWRNKRAFGYDMWSNPMRQDAMMRARDTGVAVTSGIITLVQETDDNVQRGFLMYVPVYKQGMRIENIEDRRQAFIGWVYSPFRMGDLMHGILGNEPTDIAFEIYDNDSFVQDSLLFASDHQNAGNVAFENAYLKRVATIDLQGRPWGIRFSSDAAQYGFIDRNLHWLIGAASLAIMLLVFAFTTWHANHKIRSTALIKLRTQSLEDEKRAAELAREYAEKAYLEHSFMKSFVDEHALVSTIDADGNIIDVSEKFCAATGYSRAELLKDYKRLRPSDVPESFYDSIWETIRSGKPWRGEIKNNKKNGQHLWALTTIVPLLDENNKPLKYVEVRTDITLQKYTESAERKAADHKLNQLRASLDLATDEIYLFCADELKYIYLNKAGLQKVGRTEEECIGKTLGEIDFRFNPENFEGYIEPLVSGRQDTVVFETIFDDQIPVEISLQLIKSVGENPHFIAIVRNITERKKVEKAKSEFISTISHELRTPLTSISGALSLMKSGAAGDFPESMNSLMNIAVANSKRLGTLVNEILDFEKIEAGKMDMKLVNLDIIEVVKNAVDANSTFASQFGIKFKIVGSHLPTIVNGNEGGLQQVMANLLSNAAKFSTPNGTVEISLQQRQAAIRISVADTGTGIPDEAQPFIFERFRQADSSDTRKSGGTGLGLSIAKYIVEQHGGPLAFTSTLGEGSTFYFELPIVDSEDRAKSAA